MTMDQILFFRNLKKKDNNNFKFFPSIRFEYYISLMKNAKRVIGNSSAGVREASVFGVPLN